MDWQTLQTLLAATLRHVLTTAAGSLVAHGYLMDSQTEQFIGGGMLLAGIAWSWWQKYGQALVAAELARLKKPLGGPRDGPPLTAAAVQRQMDAQAAAVKKAP